MARSSWIGACRPGRPRLADLAGLSQRHRRSDHLPSVGDQPDMAVITSRGQDQQDAEDGDSQHHILRALRRRSERPRRPTRFHHCRIDVNVSP
jgi:hypothetical protein